MKTQSAAITRVIAALWCISPPRGSEVDAEAELGAPEVRGRRAGGRVLATGGWGELHDGGGGLDVAGRRRGGASRAGPADVGDEWHVAVDRGRSERLLAPVLVQQVAEVEDVPLQREM